VPLRPCARGLSEDSRQAFVAVAGYCRGGPGCN